MPNHPVILSIIVVSYNTAEYTCACLDSIIEQTPDLQFEIIVIDNNSSDQSVIRLKKHYPRINLIELNQNVGFAAANNLAIKQAKGQWILLLNPDTIVLDQAIEKLVHFATSNTGFHLFGLRTLFANGQLNSSSCWAKPSLWGSWCFALGLARLFPESPLFNSEAIGGWNRDTVREVDIISGCCLLIKQRHWNQLGGFDTQFFMYSEDTDLCRRASYAGLHLLHCPSAEIIHYGGASEPVKSSKFIRLFEAKSLYYSIHWRPIQAYWGQISLSVWAFIRMSHTFIFQPFSKRDRQQWLTVWQHRNSWKKRNKNLQP